MHKITKVLSILLLTSISTTKPISKEMAYALTAGTSIATGMGTVYALKTNWLWALPSGALGGFLGHMFWHSFTPEGRMKRALSALNAVKVNSLTITAFDNEDKLMEAVQEMYISSEWPLIIAFNNLTVSLCNVQNAKDLAIASASEDCSFEPQATAVRAEANNIMVTINNAIKVIRNHKDYNIQLNQYKEEQRHKEKMQVQQSMVNAQWHQAHAQWHKAYSPKHVYNHNSEN